MSAVTPHTFAGGDDATSGYLDTLVDAILQLQGRAPGTGGKLDYWVNTMTAGQSIASGTTPVAIAWPGGANEKVDAANGHTAGGTTYTPQSAGYLTISASATFDASGAGTVRSCRIYKNGTLIEGQPLAAVPPVSGGTNTTCVTTACDEFFNGTTDYFEVYVTQDSGGALNVQKARVTARWVHV